MFRLDGLSALITGGGSGIGAATARAFAAAGAAVTVLDIDGAAARAVAAGLPGATALDCDITNEQQVRETFQTLSSLDVLVNNAGVGLVGSIEETEAEDFRRLFRVNVEGMYLVTRHALRLLLDAENATIINIGSVAGLVGVKRRFAYCATKGAVLAMTRQLAVDYASRLRVNCICPGTVDTPFVEGYLEKYHRHEKDKVRAELHARQPVGRMGKPEEIAEMALYLASPAAAFVTGSLFTIDGGWTAA